MTTRKISLLAALAVLCSSTVAHAALITSTLGNDTPGFADGDTPSILDLIAAQSGQPAPFDAGIGSELFGPDFSATWNHAFAAIVDPIVSATLTIGIADHDSAATGDQLSVFNVEGADMFGSLNPLFEAAGEGGDAQYDEYTIALSAALFGDLADGLVGIDLDLQGPGLQTALFGGGVSETSFNGASLIFSRLDIITRDPVSNVPEPHTTALLALGGLALLFPAFRRRALNTLTNDVAAG